MPDFPVKPHEIASGFLPPGRPNHFGLDLVAPGGDAAAVGAPEDGKIVIVYGVGADGSAPDNTKTADKRFDGYGPAGVVLQGKSGVFHLLAHMDPQGWSDEAGVKSAPGTEPTLDHPQGLVLTPTPGEFFNEGMQIGAMAPHVGTAGAHTHWEVRKTAVDNPSNRALDTFDPSQWVAAGGDTSKIARVLTVSASKDKGLPWWVWAAIGYLIVKKL